MAAMIAPRYAASIATRYAPLAYSGFPMHDMKTVEEVRRERLALLREEAGTLVALNLKLGFNTRDATLSQILNAAKNSRTQTPKQMGSKLARDLERVCGKEIGWMDTDPELVDRGMEPAVAEVATAISVLPQKQRDWVLKTVRDAISLAQETIAVNGKNVARNGANVEPSHQAPPARKRHVP